MSSTRRFFVLSAAIAAVVFGGRFVRLGLSGSAVGGVDEAGGCGGDPAEVGTTASAMYGFELIDDRPRAVAGYLDGSILLANRHWENFRHCVLGYADDPGRRRWSCVSNIGAILDSGSDAQVFVTADVSGDGDPDILQLFSGWSSVPTLGACLGSPCTTGPRWDFINPSATLYRSNVDDERFFVGDVNGDGRADVVQASATWHSLPTCTSNGASWSCTNAPATIHLANPDSQRFLSGDFDGDGRMDMFQVYRAGWQSIPVCRSTGGPSWSCTNPAAAIHDSGSDEQEFLAGDFNGDGKTDIFQTYRGWGSIPVCVSTGSGWQCSNLPAAIYNSGSPEQQFLTGDFNGDGLTDVIQTYRGWHSIPLCTSSLGWNCSNPAADIVDSGSPDQRFLVRDVNNDGKDDVVQILPTSMNRMPVCFSTGSGWSCADLALPGAIGSSGGRGVTDTSSE